MKLGVGSMIPKRRASRQCGNGLVPLRQRRQEYPRAVESTCSACLVTTRGWALPCSAKRSHIERCLLGMCINFDYYIYSIK